MQKIHVGVVGFGFSGSFIPLFQAHPFCSGVDLAELRQDRRNAATQKFTFNAVFDSFEAMLKNSKCNAVAIFTDRSRHFPFAKAALLAGKHVYSAVPMANTVDECAELVDLVKKTGLTYMMGETSIYYPAHVYCRKKYLAGEFGRFVYGEGEYLHDMAEPGCSFYQIYREAHGEQWRKFAGLPPMHYPTHSVSMVLGVTGAHMKSVSCIGLDDTANPDECWGKGRNFWDNPYSSQSALFQTSDGGMARINEFRRVGISKTNSVRLSIMGTRAGFEEQSGSGMGVCVFSDLQGRLQDPMPLITTTPDRLGAREYVGTAPIHDVHRLPESFMGLPNGHYGSHQFLVDDFLKSCCFDRTPTVSAWEAARYTVPGLIAHQSSLKDGERLVIPDFGNPPGERVDVERWV
jgi:predicted dehydrogenase